MLSAVISEDGNFSPMNVINTPDQLPMVDETPLDPHALALNAQEASAVSVAAGTACAVPQCPRLLVRLAAVAWPTTGRCAVTGHGGDSICAGSPGPTTERRQLGSPVAAGRCRHTGHLPSQGQSSCDDDVRVVRKRSMNPTYSKIGGALSE
jgi:hypothetical protein